MGISGQHDTGNRHSRRCSDFQPERKLRQGDTRGGLYGFAGADIRLNASVDITLDATIDAIVRPQQMPVFSELFFPGRLTVGARLRF